MTRKSAKKSKYSVIAFWTEDGKRYFQVGKEIDEEQPLNAENVEWKLDKKGNPVKTNSYSEALKLCK